MKKLYLFFILLLVCHALRSQDLQINFDSDKHTLSTQAAKTLLDKLSNFQSSDTILIVGHTDAVGKERYNHQLSKKRVESVKEWLIANDINPVILIDWKGENELKDIKNDAINRRVEIFTFVNNLEFPKKISQLYIIDNSKDTTLLGDEGTVIKIPAHSITIPSNKEKDLLTVSLTEYYSTSDIILNNLTTRTASDILETRGMIYLDIWQGDEKCTINKDIPIMIGFPKNEEQNKEMNIFYGKPNESNEVIWEKSKDIYTISEYSFIAEEMPQFRVKGKTYQEYLGSQIKYPKTAKENNIYGTVWISFIIDRTGNISDAQIAIPAHSSLNKEALRVINSSPSWNPGRSNFSSVNVRMSTPITFTIGDNCNYFIDSLGIQDGLNYTESRLISSIENDTVFQNSMIQNIDHYLFNALSLMWINCDWFPFRKLPRTNMRVKIKTEGNISTHIIFKKYNTVINGRSLNDYYHFSQVPMNEEIVIVAIKKSESKVYFAAKNAKTSSQPQTLDNFEEVSFEELKVKIDNLKKLL